MTDLATLTSQVLDILGDQDQVVYTDDVLAGAFRKSLIKYSLSLPSVCYAVLELEDDGKRIDISGLGDVLTVLRVCFPAGTDYENEVDRWYFYHSDDGLPYVELLGDDYSPLEDDEIKLVYSPRATIEDLDSAAASTFPPLHDQIIIAGTVAYALEYRQANLAEAYNERDTQQDITELATHKMIDYLTLLQQAASMHVTPFGDLPKRGWALDKWDTANP